MVILLHGWLHSKEIWGRIAPLLSNDFRLIAIDLPGFGESPPLRKDTISISEYAQVINVALAALDRESKIIGIVADSLSGVILANAASLSSFPSVQSLAFSGCPFNGLPTALKMPMLSSLLKSSHTSFIVSQCMFFAVIIIGVAYTFDDVRYSDNISDLWFIALLDLATGVLIFGERIARSHMITGGLAFFEHTNVATDIEQVFQNHQELFRATWSSEARIVGGVLYGLVIGVASYIISKESGYPRLAVWLTLFLFSVNYVTGSTLVSLFQFLRRSPGLVSLLRVNLWNLENPTTRYLIETSFLIGAVGFVYVSLSFTAIIFSRLNLNLLVAFYGAFALSVLSTGVFFPYIPIVRQASQQKMILLERLSAIIDTHLHSRTVWHEAIEQNAGKIDQLIAIRNKISDISVLPYRMRLVASFVPIICSAWMPFVLKFAYKTFER
jgi:pimeloyl-ACP methyl ester carboxylesterase